MNKQQSFINLAIKKDLLFDLSDTIYEIVETEIENSKLETEVQQIINLGSIDDDIHFLIILNQYKK